MMEKINMGEFIEIKALKRLVKIYNETEGLIELIKKVVNQYEPQIDSIMNKKYEEKKKEMFKESFKTTRPLFTEETTRRILKEIEERKQKITN